MNTSGSFRLRAKLTIAAIFVLGFVVFSSDVVKRRTAGQITTSPPAPVSISATDNLYNTKIGIEWPSVKGATAYRIFRGNTNDPNSGVEIGQTATNFYFDLEAIPGQNHFYWVRAQNSFGISGFSAGDQGRRATTDFRGSRPPLDPPGEPSGNTLTAAKIELGKALFWDEQLSSTRTVSCGTCHVPSHGGSDPRSALQTPAVNPGPDNTAGTPDDIFGSPGVPVNEANGAFNWSSLYGLNAQVTPRKANSVINSAYVSQLFWDGRATSVFRDPITNSIILNNGGALESQSVVPVVNGAEMAHAGRNWTEAAQRITTSKPLVLSPSVPIALRNWIDDRLYPQLFDEAFGTSDVTPSRIALAIASYERTLFADQTPLDLDAAGIADLTAAEIRGRNVFDGAAACDSCHIGSRLTTDEFFNIGVRPTNEDTGRFQTTGDPQDIGEFRMPDLRNVELRAPYMHNGRFRTLEEVVEFYNRGGDFRNGPNFANAFIRPLGLSVQQRADLVAFLKRPLTDPRVASETGKFERPRLYTESDRVPQTSGTGIAGINGTVPVIYAISPPIIGNPNFTVSLSGSVAGANAVLVVNDSDPGATSSIPSTGSFARVQTTLSTASNGSGYRSIPLQIPENQSLVGRTFYARWYITDPHASGGVSVSRLVSFTVFGTGNVSFRTRADFDGDGKTDFSVYRPSQGTWYSMGSTAGFAAISWGASTDIPTPADFDRDGKTDYAVYRRSNSPASVFWILKSNGYLFESREWGVAEDIPVFGDYDGDAIPDAAVFRPSVGGWYIQKSTGGYDLGTFGQQGDIPIAGDFDGDGKYDKTVFRDGTFITAKSTGGVQYASWGFGSDKPVPADYDGDGKIDHAIFRPSTGVWWIRRSSDGVVNGISWGQAGDVPVPGDYDGDGRNEIAVYRGGVWHILRWNGAYVAGNFGAPDDLPVPAYYLPQ